MTKRGIAILVAAATLQGNVFASTGDIDIADKAYDATTKATIVSFGTLDGVIAGDSVWIDTAGVTAAFADKNVGNDKVVSLSDSLMLAGPDASNYELVQPGELTANIFASDTSITPGELGGKLILNGFAVADKSYDGTTNAKISSWGTLERIFPGDSVWIDTTVTANFDTKNVGNNKPVTLSGLITLAGPQAGNYTLKQPSNLTANITADTSGGSYLTLEGFLVAGKYYDGNANATIHSWGTLTGFLPSDSVGFDTTGVTASFDNKNVGENKPVTLAGTIVLTGRDAANYVLTQPANLKANIYAVGDTTVTDSTVTPVDSIPAPGELGGALILDGFTVADKSYDGQTTAIVTNWGTLKTYYNGDVVEIDTTNSTVNFVDKNAGKNKNVIVIGITLKGADAGNYTFVQPTPKATIERKKLVITRQ